MFVLTPAPENGNIQMETVSIIWMQPRLGVGAPGRIFLFTF